MLILLASLHKFPNMDESKYRESSTSGLNKLKWLRSQTLLLFGILIITLGMIAGLTIGIVLSQNSRESIGSYKRAIDLLKNYPLIDGYSAIIIKAILISVIV